RKSEMTAAGTFLLLGEKVELPTSGPWEETSPKKLLRYHLHYFDDLVGDGWRERRLWHREYVQSWLDAHPPAALGTAWEPYPVSLRLVNWVKAWLRSEPMGDAESEQRWAQSAAVQTRWLIKRL